MDFRSLHLRIGLIASAFISILSSLPRFIRYENDSYITNILLIFIQFTFVFFCWLLCQFALQQGKRYPPYFVYPLLILTGGLMAVAYYTSFRHIFPEVLWNPGLSGSQRFIMNSFRGLLITSFQLFIGIYLQTQQEAQKSRIENERLKQENLLVRLDILKQQMTPHFLFNALNTISTLTEEAQTKTYTLRLAQVYRHLLQYNDNNLVTLENELEFVDAYLYIQQTRFEDALQTSIHIPDQLRQYRIPTFSIQVLIENALKHNAATLQKPLMIEIFTEDSQWLVVRNNLQPKRSVEPGNGRGLKNILDRYQLLTGESLHVDRSASHFTVKLPLIRP